MDCACCVRGDRGGRESGDSGEESRVESLLGDAVAALEREEREEKFRFQMVDLGGSTAHFRFATRMAMVRVQVAA